MKFLFSLFMIPSYLIFPVMLLAGGFVGLDEFYLRVVSGEHTLVSNTYFAFLHLSLAVGLTLAVLNSLYVFCMMIFAFIIKSWTRALVAGCSMVISLTLVYYLLNREI